MTGRRVTVEGPAGAPWLVLSNSLGTTSSLWDPQMPALRHRFRVVRYEHRGHGGTDAPPGPYTIADLAGDLLGVLDTVGAERASVMGVSLGGMVAMWLGAHRPERVERLVLACTAPQLPPPDAWAERAAQVRAHGTGQLLEGLLGRWFTPGWLVGHPAMRAEVAGMLGSASPEGYAGCCEAIGAMDQWADLAGIDAPTLVIGGAADPVSPPETAARMHRAIAGSTLVVLAGAAHLANVEQAGRFTDAVLGHLSGTPFERGDATRRAVLGDAHVDRSAAGSTPMTESFSELLTRYAWGEIWTRPGLDRRTRSAVTVAVLAALGRSEELALHVRGARRNGLSDDEIAEVLLQVAVYAGVPAANSAFGVARRALEGGDGG